MFARILIIKPSALGDVIHTLPLLRILRNSYPEARISWLVNRELQGLLEGHPDLARIFPFDRRAWGRMGQLSRTLREFSALARQLQQARFDLALDVQGLLRSGLIAYLSGASCRLGFASGREMSPLFYTLKGPVPPGEIHAVERYLYLLAPLGIEVEREGRGKELFSRVRKKIRSFYKRKHVRYGLSNNLVVRQQKMLKGFVGFLARLRYGK